MVMANGLMVFAKNKVDNLLFVSVVTLVNSKGQHKLLQFQLDDDVIKSWHIF